MHLTCGWLGANTVAVLLLLVTEHLNWSFVQHIILQLMSGGFRALVKSIPLSKNVQLQYFSKCVSWKKDR